MASAQVLRKQEHLEAGKRRLEEFRKKKAAERSKKTAATSQPNVSAVSVTEKQLVDSGHVQLGGLDGAGTSDRPNGPVEPLVDVKNDSNVIDITKIVDESSLKAKDASLTSSDHYSTSFGNIARTNSTDNEVKKSEAHGFSGLPYVNHSIQTDGIGNDSATYVVSQGRVPYGFDSDYSTSLNTGANQSVDGSLSESSLYRTQSKENNYSSDNSGNFELQSKINNSSPEVPVGNSFQPGAYFTSSKIETKEDINGSVHFNDSVNSNFVERSSNSLASNWSTGYGVSVQKSESTSFGSDSWRSSNSVPIYSASSESNPRRSRPSFLDSINLSRSSPGMSSQQTDPVKEPFTSSGSKSNGMEALGTQPFPYSLVENETLGPFPNSTQSPGGFEKSVNSVSFGKGGDLLRFNMNENSTERMHDFYSPKPNEDFAALEQHIEDLTQEKFSMQRALEASRALSESLATENSSLTDSYNQQRIVVNQLKSEMEKLQEEIKVYLVELESIKIEYANAQLECTAADERAKLLASEVIGLEEKALRLRSNELKLERELENSHSEIASYKKKLSSLEKDRQDLQSTISALQEEKKLLQSKIRKASASEKSIDSIKSPPDKKDMATSTEDLDASPDISNNETNDNASFPGSSTSNLPVDQPLDFEDSSVYIPSDQMRMIQSISALISDLSAEKEELVKALASESSQCSKLKDLNKELLHKLEVQTQRLELLTAKSMANENIPVRLPDIHNTPENITYADEGDEVVERVLGWIMKLFPGGPSRRRTSKLL